MRKLKLVINNEQKKQRNIFFVKKEMQTILNLYGEMVSKGEWKDYGLTLGPKEISFDFYLNSSDRPIFKILKNFNPRDKSEKFLIKDRNGAILERNESLSALIKKANWSRLKTVG